MRTAAHLKKKRVKRPDVEPVAHPAVNRKRVTFKKMQRYVDSILAAYAPFVLPEVMEGIRKNVAAGDTKAMDLGLRAFKVIQPSGVNVTQMNNNAALAAGEAVGGHKTFDAYIRDRAVDKRMVLDIAPAAEESDEECSSKPQQLDGSEMLESQS